MQNIWGDRITRDKLWKELERLIDDYFISKPRSIWKDKNGYLRSSFRYYYNKIDMKKLENIKRVVNMCGWEVLKQSKPQRAKATDYYITIHLRRKEDGEDTED